MDQRIRLRHLRCFIEIARHGSITRAAAALHTVQPSVSRSLRELEDAVGRPLFERTGQGLVLTGAGEILLRHAGVGLTQIATGVRYAQEPHAMRAVSLYVLPNVARTIAPRAIARFKAAAPETAVRVVSSPANKAVDYLREGTIDFLFGRLFAPDRMRGLSFEQLYSEPLIFVARPGHPLAAREAVTLEAIDAGLVLVPQEATIIRDEMDKFLIAHGLAAFANRVETISFELIRAVLADSEAVACVPVGAVRPELADGRLVRLGIDTEAMVSAVGLSFASGREINPMATALADLIRDEAKVYAMSEGP